MLLEYSANDILTQFIAQQICKQIERCSQTLTSHIDLISSFDNAGFVHDS